MSSRSRIKVPAKKPRSWAVTLIKNRGAFLGLSRRRIRRRPRLAAVRAFNLSEWQRKRLLVRERG
jgi:hypothetical protein